MFGGMKFHKNSELLRDADAGKSNAGAAVTTVNDSLFQMVIDAENHAKQIIKTGQSQYVDGIKQNVIDMVRLWLQEEGSNIFTLYGKMGCGKSFFSARLYEELSAEKDTCDTVAFSSQQIYRDTANVRNMLISLAHQLFGSVPVCGEYFARHQLDNDSIADLTESVLVRPFEGVQLAKTVFVIIDGLDEYPRQDCETFLEALGRLRTRLHPRVKIFFTSRPEAYIMSEMSYDSEEHSYHIEKNEAHSHADCARFVDVKCRKAGIQIDEAMKGELIKKSECSLKYLECFFNDISCGSIQVTADFIDSLPMGLSHYYRDQLVRYFGDEGLRFYQTKIVPLLELLCVVWRPITIEEASDILGCRESDINQIISRSGTLLWRNNRYVMLYQSESIREFLMDERYCPEKYRIDSKNGNDCVLRRLEEMMDLEEDIENNMYLFNCAVDHITERERLTAADWNLLVRMVACYSHKADVRFKLAGRIMAKSPREIMAFVRCLYANKEIDPLLQDAFSVRLIAAAILEKQTDKFLSVLDMLEGPEQFDFIVNYGRGRIYRNNNKKLEALKVLRPGVDAVSDDEALDYRRTYYVDEVCRIYRSLGTITWEENTDLHIQVIRDSEKPIRKYQRSGGSVYLVLQRNLSVSYGQLARLCELLEEKADPQLRQVCGSKIQELLQLPESDFNRKGYFLLASEACDQINLRLSKLCQQYDSYSDSRIYDLHFSFYSLGILYFRKDFPGYNPDKALQYFEDALNSIMDIALRPESHERYLQVPIKLYRKLAELYSKEANYSVAKKYLAEGVKLQDLQMLYRPGAKSEYARCYGYEQEADIVLEEQGIDAAESYYLAAARHYEACAQQYADRSAQRAPHVIYYKIAKAFKAAGNLQKFVDYSWLELEGIKKTYALYPSAAERWDMAVVQELIANAMRKLDKENNRRQRMDLWKNAIEIYLELAQKHPDVEKYQSAPCVVYYDLFLECCELGLLEDAQIYLEKADTLCRHVAQNCPNHKNLVDLPIWMFLFIQDLLPDEESYQQYLGWCKEYIAFTDACCDKRDCIRAKCLFLRHEAQRAEKKKGIEAAEPLYMTYSEEVKAFAKLFPGEESCQWVFWCYTDLFEGFRKIGQRTKAICYGQEALEIADRSIEYLPSCETLRKQRGLMYGMLADLLKEESDVQMVSTAGELYIMQVKQYIQLFAEVELAEDKKELAKYVTRAYTDLTNFLQLQERMVKTAVSGSFGPMPLLRDYVQILVNIYTFLAQTGIQGAQEKLDRYTELLSKLESE